MQIKRRISYMNPPDNFCPIYIVSFFFILLSKYQNGSNLQFNLEMFGTEPLAMNNLL